MKTISDHYHPVCYEPAYPYQDNKGQWRETPNGDNLGRKTIPSGHQQYLRNSFSLPNEQQLREQWASSLNFVPVIGQYKSWSEGITGEEWFTGGKLSLDERKFAIILPMRLAGGSGLVAQEVKGEIRALASEEGAIARSSSTTGMAHMNPIAAEANTAGQGRFVYRGLNDADIKSVNAGQGINAKNPNANNSAVSHIAGKQNTRWISTTWDEEIAKAKYGEKGYVKIDLYKVQADKVDVSKGFPYMSPKATFNKWAKKDKELLIEGHIPRKQYQDQTNDKRIYFTARVNLGC